MARDPLPINSDHKFESSISGIPNSDPKKQIPTYPARIVARGGQTWAYDNITDDALFPQPRSETWADGWVAQRTARVMMTHPAIYRGVNLLKNQILGSGGRWLPSINPYGPDKADFQEAVKYMKFMAFSDANVRGSIRGSDWATKRQLLDCIFEGNKIAPLTWREETDSREWKGKWPLGNMQVWQNDTYTFFHDEFNNFAEVRVGNGGITPNGTADNRFPIERFFTLSYRPINDNPYGSKILSAAYEAFYDDIHTVNEENLYMATHSRPSILIFAAPPPIKDMEEEPQPLRWGDGTPVLEHDPDAPGQMRERYGYGTEQNAILFTDFRAGSIWSLAHGAIVEVVEAQKGGAEVFASKRARNERAMIGAILGTSTGTDATGIVSKGNADLTESTINQNAIEGKAMLENAEEQQIARPTLIMNFGKGAADLLPRRDYGAAQTGRQVQNQNSIVGYVTNGGFDKAQWWDYCCDNGLPLPWPDATPLIVNVPLDVTKTGGGDKTGKGTADG